jgi:hypothetical protein
MAACFSCGTDAVVQWVKRPMADELAAYVAVVQQQQAAQTALADPQQPAPVFPALPTASDTTVPVYACASHSLSIEDAALVHAANCTGPNPANSNHCDCQPEPAPVAPASPAEPVSVLPAGWGG